MGVSRIKAEIVLFIRENNEVGKVNILEPWMHVLFILTSHMIVLKIYIVILHLNERYEVGQYFSS